MSTAVPVPPIPRARRNHLLDLLRIIFAVAVIVAHAPEIIDGNRSRELFGRLTHSGLSLGDVAVDGFFLLSGYLIVGSWLTDPKLSNFLRKRLLRIVPGYLVAALLSTLAIGLLAPGVPHFFAHLNLRFLLSLLKLDVPHTPPVLPGQPFASVNTPLWTIAYEFRCYLLVALLGSLSLLRRPAVWLALTLAFLSLQCVPSFTAAHPWRPLLALAGDPSRDLRLASAFFVGGCFLLFRDHIPFRPALALGAAIALILVELFLRQHLQPALMLFGGYLLFYLAALPLRSLDWMQHVPDISYGVYLYGWPVECLWIWYVHGSPWVAALVSAVLCFAIGWLSWHFVERPMLRLKRRPSAPLPPA